MLNFGMKRMLGKGMLLWPILGISALWGQVDKEYQLRSVAFYNVENLFDTINDPLTQDDARTPKGRYRWTKSRYDLKIKNLARVISQIGADTRGTPPDIIGLCEVENSEVLQDLIADSQLAPFRYRAIHLDGTDERGIETALLYKNDSFLPLTIKSIPLKLFNEKGFRDHTRDQLVVEGLLDTERFYFIVNHWPSRSGGELRSKPYRIQAARLNRKLIDSIQIRDPRAKIISMGDFNDNPLDDSFKKVLGTLSKRGEAQGKSLYNPMELLYRKGIGSLAYRDQWHLFDQFFMTAPLDTIDRSSYSFWKAFVFQSRNLSTSSGNYKGYPFRTFVGTTYQGGYSDHFPIGLFLIKTAE